MGIAAVQTLLQRTPLRVILLPLLGVAWSERAVALVGFAVAGAALNFLPMTAESMRTVILDKATSWSERDRDAAIAALDAGIEVGRTAPVA